MKQIQTADGSDYELVPVGVDELLGGQRAWEDLHGPIDRDSHFADLIWASGMNGQVPANATFKRKERRDILRVFIDWATNSEAVHNYDKQAFALHVLGTIGIEVVPVHLAERPQVKYELLPTAEPVTAEIRQLGELTVSTSAINEFLELQPTADLAAA
jgi:hypothetical protein